MDLKLKNLRDNEAAVAENLKNIREKIAERESEILLPAYKKKRLGKYFKFRDSYNSIESWPVYIKVNEVAEVNLCYGSSFEMNSRGEIEFSLHRRLSEGCLLNGITKKEFETEYKKMMKKINFIK